ncbi:type II secretion system protein GspG [Labrys sp. La1]|uniref:type II secretion system protein GspG n=1 Tax=Labrys sp. La1 TaxID=3404917 RepID=UPI003EBB086B
MTRNRESAFTLIEALVVLVIIGLIMGRAALRVLNDLSSSKEKAAHLQVKAFSNAVDLYYLDTGHYPAATEGLQALVQKPVIKTM